MKLKYYPVTIIALMVLNFYSKTSASSDILLYMCHVESSNPYETKTYIPHNSSMQLDCTATINEDPVWSILLAGSDSPVRFTASFNKLLQRRGIHELPDKTKGNLKTISLNITNTNRNNGTVVECSNNIIAKTISLTTIAVYDIMPMDIHATDEAIQSSNISFSTFNEPLNYTLTAMSANSQPRSYKPTEPYFVFHASEGAPACEVYNFSITATYIGATYTGAGCSLASPVISRVLPSLPDISQLQSSLNYSLIKKANYVTLITTFMPAGYCQEYPVDNYTFTIIGHSHDSEMSLTTLSNSIITNDLMEDTIYKFRIEALNSIGSDSTNETTVYTTDVQRVKAILSILLEAKSIIVCCQCDFITGSNAKGCKVVLVGQSLNHPMSFTKQNISTTSIMGNYSLGYEKFCKHDIVQVMAYDIEENGIEGNVTVPGSVEWSSNSENNLQQLCNQTSGFYSVSPLAHYTLMSAVVLSVASLFKQ